MKRSIAVFFAALGLATACSADDGNAVEMVDGLRFQPETVTIRTGDAVTWTNADDESHTVTAVEDSLPDGAEFFASGDFDGELDANGDLSEGLLAEGEEFSHTFETPGTYRYYCIPHRSSGMTGTIVVEGGD